MPVIRYQPAADDEGSSQGDPSVSPDDLYEFTGPAGTGPATTTARRNFTYSPGTVTMDGGDPWMSWGNSWTTGTTTTTYTNTINTNDFSQPPQLQEVAGPTAEERAEQERFRELRRRQREELNLHLAQERQERQVRRDAAQARATELLRLTLLPDELAHFDQTGDIVVTGSDNRRYQVNEGVVSNIILLASNPDEGYRGRLAALCAHPNLAPGYSPDTGCYEREIDRDGLPQRDAHVAQVLALRHDAPSVWRRANVDWQTDRGEQELRNWSNAHKFRGWDEAEDTEGVSAEARAAFPAAEPEDAGRAGTRRLRDRLGRFAGREAA